MRALSLVLLAALLPVTAMAAEPQKKKASPPPANPCAQYGEGFVQVKGSTTCIKVGGYIRIDIGGR